MTRSCAGGESCETQATVEVNIMRKTNRPIGPLEALTTTAQRESNSNQRWSRHGFHLAQGLSTRVAEHKAGEQKKRMPCLFMLCYCSKYCMCTTHSFNPHSLKHVGVWRRLGNQTNLDLIRQWLLASLRASQLCKIIRGFGLTANTTFYISLKLFPNMLYHNFVVSLGFL